jgi:hypothetical protein
MTDANGDPTNVGQFEVGVKTQIIYDECQWRPDVTQKNTHKLRGQKLSIRDVAIGGTCE